MPSGEGLLWQRSHYAADLLASAWALPLGRRLQRRGGDNMTCSGSPVSAGHARGRAIDRPARTSRCSPCSTHEVHMRFLRSTTLLAVTGALAAACTPDAVTGSVSPRVPAGLPGAPAFDISGSTPAPEILSATLVDKSTVRITFIDNASDEWMTSAYFTPSASFSAGVTANIVGTPGTGERTVDVTLPAGYTTVRLRHGWSSSAVVWSAFSNAATIGSSTGSVATKTKGRGK